MFSKPTRGAVIAGTILGLSVGIPAGLAAPAEAAVHDICMVNATTHNLYVNGHKVRVGQARCDLTRNATVRSNSQRFRFSALFGRVGTACLQEDRTYRIGTRVDIGPDHILYAQGCR